ncbi:sugar transferase [Spirosoma fluviale]|uniref:Putative colanic acid biosysnthesis UDP-glucose lipid carrier transferase n=1 Tax=Spirosoma fluviale TaxID=1597977 RepID=A0A286G8G8_9BACT|nr:sugar transferase [Spirosoma fluviale]SOD91811.1 putative colanic acid biosysnthesis UDP-glucose lipid carrier transferase [Spirosoma fluviale]
MLSNASLSNTRPYTETQHEVYTSSVSEKGLLSKRIFDIVFSLSISLFVLFWLIPLLGLAIRINSPGPMLFVQLRTGRNGRQFRCFKLRTMITRQDNTFQQATKNDPRVTRLGQILRKTNLDELPQFLNVLQGDMSIVGPRPHPIPLDAQHWYSMPNYPERYNVKPGITGLAQVRGCRGETDTLIKMEHRVRLDRWYINNRSFILDVKICWWTVYNMIKGDKKAW